MIEVNSLSYEKILHSISFSTPQGSSLAVIGHNGAGKTTLFHVLLGLKHKSSGNFHVHESKLGFVPERPYLSMDDVFEDFLRLHLNLISFPKADQNLEILRVAQSVGLVDQLRLKFDKFSKGMLQKALLAQALLGSPRLVVLDEPLSGLDPESRLEAKKKLIELKQKGVTLIFSSHIMEDVVELADYVLILDHGKQSFFGRTQEWRSK